MKIKILLILSLHLYASSFPSLNNKQGVADRNNNVLIEERYKVWAPLKTQSNPY